MAQKRKIRFGVIGCGLMGREFASAAARWCHLLDVDFQPEIIAACDANPQTAAWFQENVPSVQTITADYHDLLNDPNVEAIYCAVPHNLHAKLYTDIIAAGKHLLGEKPFGIDRAANQEILAAIEAHPEVVVRCSSEFPFMPGALRVAREFQNGGFGDIIEVEAGFWHSSDLDPHKPINWKRQVAFCGEYGCMGDLGMHVLHLPLRLGLVPRDVRALLSKIVPERPDGKGGMAPCETWDNAILACTGSNGAQEFPMLLSTKRIAPGHANTWFIRIAGTQRSAEFSTKNPKQFMQMIYDAKDPALKEQAWRVSDIPYDSAYPTITGGIFEFGFSDAVLQMWAAFCDEVAHGGQVQGPFGCATPREAAFSHEVFTAALESNCTGQTVQIPAFAEAPSR
jgi:predicted dehydrogenase